MLAQDAVRIARIAKETESSPQTVYRIKDDKGRSSRARRVGDVRRSTMAFGKKPQMTSAAAALREADFGVDTVGSWTYQASVSANATPRLSVGQRRPGEADCAYPPLFAWRLRPATSPPGWTADVQGR
jgi:hypothetical protein